jgi:MFS transporter, ACS family, glucarate transporter
MKRYLIVGALFILSMILYIDRVCISTAKEPITMELALSDKQMGAVFSAFALGYAAGQIPSGYFADKIGPRIALTTVVSLWSILTAFTGLAQGFISLIIIRFLFGLGEAGAYPSSARVLYNWLPLGERGRANGITFSGARIGAAISFPLLTWMLDRWAWRLSFVILGIAGILWAIIWFIFFRDYPEKRIEAEISIERPELSFRKTFNSSGMRLAMVQYFANNFTFFICLSWMFPYLKEHYHLSNSEAASYSVIPLLVGACGHWIAGFTVDGLYRSGYQNWSRRLPAIIGFLFASTGMILITSAMNPTMAVIWFSVATLGTEMTISPSWTYCMDIGGKNSGTVSASMNMFGNIGAFVSANAFPYLYALTGNANTFFYTAVALNILAIICWLYMRSKTESIVATNKEQTA